MHVFDVLFTITLCEFILRRDYMSIAGTKSQHLLQMLIQIQSSQMKILGQATSIMCLIREREHISQRTIYPLIRYCCNIPIILIENQIWLPLVIKHSINRISSLPSEIDCNESTLSKKNTSNTWRRRPCHPSVCCL